MSSQSVSTFCRICEPMCGVLATVENGRITDIDANTDHVSSRGHFCKKARGMIDVNYDPDRVLHPLKRVGKPGEFVRVSWDQAYSEIAAKLTSIREQHGKDSVAIYKGNPPYYSYAAMLWLNMFKKAMDIRWSYAVNGEDANAAMATSSLLYGSVGVMPKPDCWRTEFLVIAGANPLVTHGSPLSEPRIGTALKGITDRGGRVVVIDPRRTETAREFEHVAIHSGTDAYLLSAMIREIIHAGLIDRGFLDRHTKNIDLLAHAVRHCTPEWAETFCGVDAATIRRLALDFASARSAAFFNRLGTSSQRYGTLSTTLSHVLCIITGNLDSPGGLVFGWGIVDLAKMVGTKPIGTEPSRVDKMPDVGGDLPSVALINDIGTPGEGQVRALIMAGGNPCLNSAGAGPRMDAALQKLQLFVSNDLYLNDSNQHAHYILPTATFFEREDVPFLGMGLMIRPTIYATKAVVEKQGEVKEDWEILDDICRYMGLGGALPNKALQLLAKAGLRITPRHILDLIIRTSVVGDKFGLKPTGLSLTKLLDHHPNGVLLKEALPTGVFERQIMTPDKRVDLAHPSVLSELRRLPGDGFYQQRAFPLRLFGMRKKSTQNSWMHNVAMLAKDHQQIRVLIHPTDAAASHVDDGDLVRIQSAHGRISIVAQVTDAVKPGNVCVPHGWGHTVGMLFAQSEMGVNSNILSSDQAGDTDRVSGMSVLNGIPVNIALDHAKY